METGTETSCVKKYSVCVSKKYMPRNEIENDDKPSSQEISLRFFAALWFMSESKTLLFWVFGTNYNKKTILFLYLYAFYP